MKSKKFISALSNVFPIVLIGTTLLSIIISYWVWVDVKKDSFKDLEYTATVINNYYELAFNQREIGLLSVGKRLISIEGERAIKERLKVAKDELKLYKEFLAFGLADTTGQLITFTGSSEEQKNLPNLASSPETKRTFMQVKHSNKLVIGEVYYFKEVNDWILPIRVPIRDSTEKLVAVNTCAIDYHNLVEELKKLNINKDYKISFVNSTYNTAQIYHPLSHLKYDSVLTRSTNKLYSNLDTLQHLNQFIHFSGFNEVENMASFGVQTSPNKYHYHLVVTVSQSILWKSFRESFYIILFVYFFIILNLLMVFRYFRKKEKSYVEKIKTERDYFTKIINATHTIIVGLDADFKCTFLNPSAEKLSGYKQKDVKGKGYWRVLYPEEDYYQVEDAFKILQHNNVLYNHEMKLTAKSGEKKVISWSTENFYDKDGKIKEIICFGIDITERRNAEITIRESQANLKSIFESTTNIIGLFNLELELIEYNNAFVDYARDINNLNIYKGIPILNHISETQQQAFDNFLNRALKGEKLSEIVEYKLEEERLFFMLSFNPIIRDNKITGVAMFIQDISELKSIQNELKRYNETLETIVKDRTNKLENANSILTNRNRELQMQREELKVTIENLKETQSQLIQAEKMASLGILAAGVGHEINNPLNFIRGGANGIVVQLNNVTNKEITTKVKPFIKIINEGVDRAATIVKSLRHFSRQGVDMHEQCNVNDVLDNCLVILHNKTKHKVEITKNYDDTALVVCGNEGKLHQAFLNILANSEQAIEEHGEIKITTLNLEKEVLISIADSGYGIDKDHLDKISDPFFTTKSPGEGTGLGLSITYNIIEEHGGNIKVKSEINKGTEFIVSLPKEQ